MQKDPILKFPTSVECNNNLKDSSKFLTFLTAESLNQCHFGDREKVYHFLAGLDEDFLPVTLYINTLMAAWGQQGINPKAASAPSHAPSKIFSSILGHLPHFT
jgi:hypothetical protein